MLRWWRGWLLSARCGCNHELELELLHSTFERLTLPVRGLELFDELLHGLYRAFIVRSSSTSGREKWLGSTIVAWLLLLLELELELRRVAWCSFGGWRWLRVIRLVRREEQQSQAQ